MIILGEGEKVTAVLKLVLIFFNMVIWYRRSPLQKVGLYSHLRYLNVVFFAGISSQTIYLSMESREIEGERGRE